MMAKATAEPPHNNDNHNDKNNNTQHTYGAFALTAGKYSHKTKKNKKHGTQRQQRETKGKGTDRQQRDTAPTCRTHIANNDERNVSETH